MYNNLKKLRQERNMTFEQFAEQFGVDMRTAERWQNQKITRSHADEIARFFNVNVEEVVDETQNFREIKIGKTGSIDKGNVKKEILHSFNWIYKTRPNIYRDILIDEEYIILDEMMSDFIEVGLKVTDLFSRIHVKYRRLDLKETFDLPCRTSDDYELQLTRLSIELFHYKYGTLNCEEIRECIKLVYDIFNKYDDNPLYELMFVFERFIIDLSAQIWNNYDRQFKQVIIGEQIIWFYARALCKKNRI